MGKKNGKATSNVLDIPVEFGGVSIGQQTAKLGLKISREVLNINAADEALCGRRVTGRVGVGGAGDSPGQMYLIDDMEDVINATFDIHRFGVTPDNYTSGLTFKLKEIEIGILARFSKGAGRLVIENIDAIPEDVVDEHDSEGQKVLDLKTDQPWRKVSLDELFSGAILKNLKAEGLSTIGDLSDFQEPNKSTGYTKNLTDIKGIGEAAATKIADVLEEFWRQNPQDGE